MEHQHHNEYDMVWPEILLLLGHGFPIRHISLITNVAERTLWRWLSQNGIRVRDKYTKISDEYLKNIFGTLLAENPLLGSVSLYGKLQARGLVLQKQRIQKILKLLKKTDGEKHTRLKRRTYFSRAPLTMVHIDSYMKLIRYGFAIHGAIDGYSRICLYLCVNNNNRASTVLKCFKKGVAEYGLPSRVRSDKGGENISIGRFMLENRGTDRRSFITGKSVNNQRIERFWVDVWNGCISVFYNLFMDMEEGGILDPDSDIDIYCLHLCFLHLIQEELEELRIGWNAHRIRTANHMTPNQLFIFGLHSISNHAKRTGKVFTELVQDFQFSENEGTNDDLAYPSLEVSTPNCPIDEENDWRIRTFLFPKHSINKYNAIEVYTLLKLHVEDRATE